MKTVLLTACCFICSVAAAQNITTSLADAVKKLEADTQFKHAIISMYVADTKTGKPVFEKNAQVGLAPASCQKVITSASAFEMLGKDFTYKTYIGKNNPGENKYDAGSLFIIGTGDPASGSWRWKQTAGLAVYDRILASLKKKGLYSFEGNLIVVDDLYGLTPLPEGWIWQDIGNYYGAACFGFNWRENQYDMVLQSGAEGNAAKVIRLNPEIPGADIRNTISIAGPKTGDNGYIYTSPYSNIIITKGTVPSQNTPFTISGSMPNPAIIFKQGLFDYLFKNGVAFKEKPFTVTEAFFKNVQLNKVSQLIDSIESPSLDSMNYWFLKRSINLYGEAFLKTMGMQKTESSKKGDVYEKSIEILKQFWKQRGIEPAALNISDGSGLSPASRVTTHALVTVMQYAKKQAWFSSFYNALPEMNGIKMKDGYISGVRSYTGYIKSKNGSEYTFSFIVNNFNGSPGTVREKMWKVLDILK